MISSRCFTARHRCHSNFPTSAHILSSLPSPLYHYLPSSLATRLLTITLAHRRCLCLCLCLCLFLCFTSRCWSRSERTIRSTSLAQPTPSSLDQPSRGTIVSRPVIVVVAKLVLIVSKTLRLRSYVFSCLFALIGWVIRVIRVRNRTRQLQLSDGGRRARRRRLVRAKMISRCRPGGLTVPHSLGPITECNTPRWWCRR